jgi:hypothetical protein
VKQKQVTWNRNKSRETETSYVKQKQVRWNRNTSGVKALLIRNFFLQARRLTGITAGLFYNVRWGKFTEKSVKMADPEMGDIPRKCASTHRLIWPTRTQSRSPPNVTRPICPSCQLVSGIKIAATKAMSPRCPWNSATMAAVPNALPKHYSQRRLLHWRKHWNSHIYSEMEYFASGQQRPILRGSVYSVIDLVRELLVMTSLKLISSQSVAYDMILIFIYLLSAIGLTPGGSSTVQYSTAQYSTVQYSTVQYSTVQCSAVQCSAVQYSTVQYSTVQCSAVQCSAVQYSTVQYRTVQ